ncbi:MAG: AAA family ATPase, partial [Deltaproteobacteria bacterium]|nr:AAA family ATPase [Deltaproteobacteria bacterium]
LIGPNGAGKSNFIGFFKMLQELLKGRMQIYVGKQGGPDALLHFGRKNTTAFHFELYSSVYYYSCELEPTQANTMLFAHESAGQNNLLNSRNMLEYTQYGRMESALLTENLTHKGGACSTIFSQKVYHFHDTGDSALVKQRHGINDNAELKQDAANLGAFLYHLRKNYPKNYRDIVTTVQLVAPFFDDFFLRPNPDHKDYIELEWMEHGSDIPFKAYALSDGSLRFICLATVLLQPAELQPEIILIDEPELGLHPAAINILAGMLRSVSADRQIIVSTQSTDLLNEFTAEDVIVAEREQGETNLHRLDTNSLSVWLEEYSLGELWYKNILGGRPSR